MLVLSRDETRRLGGILPPLAAAIKAGESWPGANVLIRWGGGEFIAKLVHHKHNGNVKFTVPKRNAGPLWHYIHGLRDRPLSARRFSARYLRVDDTRRHDEIVVNASVPPGGVRSA